MRKIRVVLRLYFAAALSIRAIARSLGTSPLTVGEYLRRAKVAGLSWPVPETIDDAGLERRLFPAPPSSRARLGVEAHSEGVRVQQEHGAAVRGSRRLDGVQPAGPRRQARGSGGVAEGALPAASR